jgi:hypothetical protein
MRKGRFVHGLNKAGAVASPRAANLTPRRHAFQHFGGRSARRRRADRRRALHAPKRAQPGYEIHLGFSITWLLSTVALLQRLAKKAAIHRESACLIGVVRENLAAVIGRSDCASVVFQ